MEQDVIVVGAGMAGLTAACRLSAAGMRIMVLEQNYLPGGCTSSYWRKGYVFESGATTLVGLDEGMPLHHLLDVCELQIPAWKLEVPMKVRLANGKIITRHADLEAWIGECEATFGPQGQRPFWTQCKQISDFVWRTSVGQLRFPPERPSDLVHAASRAKLEQVLHLPYAAQTVSQLLKKHGLDRNALFVSFVNEQLMITAQNNADEVNLLFGATALCYTLVGNYYMPGGLLELVTPLVNYVERKNGHVLMRYPVDAIRYDKPAGQWVVTTRKTEERAKYLISALPLNNTVKLMPGLEDQYEKQLMPSNSVASAFQMGIAFKPHRQYDCLHHQLHLPIGLPGLSSGSVFLSLSHPDDASRSDYPGQMVASISTHVHNPAANMELDKAQIEQVVIQLLSEANLILPENIVYRHSSGPSAWQKWTGREWGFVGGYPQYKSIKPWQMVGHRMKGYRTGYLCGDTTYPGQGIPGACLSGLIAAEKLLADRG